MLEKARVLACQQRFHQKVRDVRALYQTASGTAGHDDFLALAVVKNGARRQLGDLVEIEAHRQHEIKEADSC